MCRSRLVACCAVLFALACQDAPQPTFPPLSAEISDAMHGTDRNPHFWLLPPVVPPTRIPEKFNRGLSPRVRITEMAPEGTMDPTVCPDGEIDYITTTDGPNGRVVMDAANSHYSLLWQTKNYMNVGAPCVYRLAVELSGTRATPGIEIGFADVQMLTSASMKSLVSDEFIPLPEDRSFPFRFFIGHGAAFFELTGDDACRENRDCGEAVLDPTQDNVVLTEDQRAGIFVPDAALKDDEGDVVLIIEERPDRPCFDERVTLLQFDDCYRFEAIRIAPDDGDDVGGGDFVITQEGEQNTTFRFDANYTIGICVEVGDLTPEEAELLQIYRFEPGTGELSTLDDVPAPFLPCDPAFQPGESSGSRSLLQRGWQLVQSGLRALLGPRILYASSAVIDVGLGGSGDELSYFTWGPPGQITMVSEDPQTAEEGTSVGSPPAVQITDFSAEPEPIANVRVIFEVTGGGGTIQVPGTTEPMSGTTFTVRTDTNGVASLLGWTLGPDTGATNTVTARIFGGVGSPDTTFTATAVTPSLAFREVSTGGALTCGGLNADSSAWCWGVNGQFIPYGVLGTFGPLETCGSFPCSRRPVAIPGGLAFTQLDAGANHVCGMTASPEMFCWGRGNAGQLGNGATDSSATPVPVTVSGVTFNAITSGGLFDGHSCGLSSAGAVYCWGANTFGQLGNGTTVNSAVPVLIDAPEGVSFTPSISAGSRHTCGLTPAGDIYCWGGNARGELGNGTNAQSATPVLVLGDHTWAAVSAGHEHTCAITASGTGSGEVYCWGRNDSGQLGTGSTGDSNVPVAVNTTLAFRYVGAGGFHTCGLTAASAAYCWGGNLSGELGTGSFSASATCEVPGISGGTQPCELAPVPVTGGHVFGSLAAEGSSDHVCGIADEDGVPVVYCWGLNNVGQLGIDAVGNRASPTRVARQ